MNITLILLALNLIAINLVIADSSFMMVSTIYVLLGVIVFNIPFRKLYNTIIGKNKEKKSIYRMTSGLILILFSFILLLVTDIQMLWLTSIPTLLSGLNLTLQGVKIKRKELHLLSVVSFIYALFYILVQTIPTLWYSIQQLSLLFSKAIGIMVSKPLLLGPSTSGLWIVIIFFILSCCMPFLSYGKKKYFLFNVIGLTVCWIVYLIILSFVDFKSKSDVLNLHYLLFIFCLIPTFVYLAKIRFKEEQLDILGFKDIKLIHVVKNGAAWALVLLLISCVVLTVFLGANSTNNNNAKKNILFYGHNMLGSWDVPEYGKYGRSASGMFGLLPYYLNNSGYNTGVVVGNRTEFLNATLPIYENVTRCVNLTDYTTIIESKTITKDLLNNFDIFVVINLNTSFSENEYEVIWDFVEKGGSLLVLGDHTDIGGMMSPLNQLLKPIGMNYRFDDALPIDTNFKWIPCYHLMHHPVTYRIDSLDEIEISVGASLDINAGSFPVILGRYGLSDEGDRLNVEKAYLGDYEYNKGEQIGDIILVAGAYYGNGKVLVFGDTSSFQNSAIINSLPFLNSVFNWLGSQRTSTIEYAQTGISLILLIGAFVLYLRFGKSKIQFVLFPLALCIALVISAVAIPMILGQEEVKGNIVYVDASHVERFSLDPFEDNSLTGTMLNLMRNNYLPLLLRDFSKDKIKNSVILIFNAPTKTFSGDEIEFLKQYIQNGGLVILSTGYPDKDASMPLLREFGLDIADIPLGPIPYVEENPEEYQKEPRFVDSWPIVGDIGEDENDTTYPFYSVEIDDYEYVLMTFTRYGDGGLLLIGDSEFLMDKNIESLDDYWPGNIQFLKNILDEMKTKGVLK
ncbi:MAG: hypothetical protein QHH19_06385 [Candidatus Thermoplasmatota archaeon]|nr:hypothetical protein [Candidatus Thermoplasmatota archaeon]